MNVGDRVWLLPDGKREVSARSPGVIMAILDSGRARVDYIDMGCRFTKTVQQKRLEPRSEPCKALKE